MIASRAMALDLDAITSYTLGRKKLDPAQVSGELAALGPRWTLHGPDLQLVIEVKPMAKAAEVAGTAAKLADDMDHHPTITLEYKGITLAIHTHDVGGITMTDLVYAARLERWLRANRY
jgi:4a-hydroxytetrahydrobiopterin dehydratase